MLNRLTIEFTLDKEQKIDYNIGSVLQGIMMTFLDRDYGEILHKQSLRPYSQYFEIKNGKYYWVINTLTKEAKQKIIDKILISDRKELDLIYRQSKLNIEKLELQNDNTSKYNGKREITINFKTPTSFKRTSGGYEIFPNIKHIFNSLINKYEKFESNRLDDSITDLINNKDELLEKIIQNVEITGYDLKTAKFGVKGNYVPGFMGKVYLKVKGSQDFKNIVIRLLKFGEYSGVGLKATMGMGAIQIK